MNRKLRTGSLSISLCATAALLIGCGGDKTPELTTLDLSVCAPGNAGFTVAIDNPYFPLPVGLKLVLEGDDDGTRVRVEITVLDQTREVAGVTTRVVEEAEYEDGELIEISRNYFVQASEGTVCYFGEEVDIYQNDQITGHGGAWLAGEGSAAPGIIMPGSPVANTQFAQENAPGVAQDMSAIVAVGETVSVPAGDFSDVLRARDWNPLEGQSYSGGETKIYVRDIGLVVDDVVKLISY